MTTENEFSWHEKNYGTGFKITIEGLLQIYPEPCAELVSVLFQDSLVLFLIYSALKQFSFKENLNSKIYTLSTRSINSS